MDDEMMIRDVPSTVHMDDDVVDTPRSSNRHKMKSKSINGVRTENEVDAYENPTELFQWINYGNYRSAASHALENPGEARMWIVSRQSKRGKKGEQIKWRYLPLHLVCMKSNPSRDLLRTLMYTYPAAARERDYNGNLPIHYLLEEGCDHGDIIQMLLKAYPESIEKRDRKGRTLLEIVSEGYRSGKLSKDTMVNMLAILRQWSISEERSVAPSVKQNHQRDGGEEDREGPPALSRETSSFEQKEDGHKRNTSRTKRSTSRSRQEVEDDFYNISSNHKDDSNRASRDNMEVRLETTLTERDVLRKTVNKLTNENKTQEMALVALNKQVEEGTSELQKLKDKLKKKKERIAELETKVKDQEERLSKHEHIFLDKEHKLAGEERHIKALSDKFGKLSEENDQLRRDNLHYYNDLQRLADRLEEREKENQDLKEKIEEALQSRSVAVEAQEVNCRTLQERITELEEALEAEMNETRDVRAIRGEADATEMRLRSQITVLEKELKEFLETDQDGNFIRGKEVSSVQQERDALKEMNASLQEHLVALKQRLDQMEYTEKMRMELEKTIHKLESDLLHARLKQSEYHEQLEHTKSESLINESRLQTKIAKLEKELLEIVGSKDQTKENTEIGDEDDKCQEEKRSLQLMNTSLQEHIAALKEKCSTLESNLEQEKKKNKALSEPMRGGNMSVLGHRQKELQTEFHQLISMVQGMAGSGTASEIARSLAQLQTEKDSLRKEASSLRARVSEYQSEIGRLHSELHGVRAAFGSMKATSDGSGSKNFDHNTRLDQEKEQHKANEGEAKNLIVQLREMTSRAETYKEQLGEIKERFEALKSNNSNLRDIIAKNNETYLARVDSLTKEMEELRSANESLHSHVHELSLENEKVHSTASPPTDGEGYNQRIEEMNKRINQVAGYLVAVSLLMQEEYGDFESGGISQRREDEYIPTSPIKKERRDEVRGELFRRQTALLAGEDRDDIVQNANQYGHEMRSSIHHPQTKHLSAQQHELNSISASLKQLTSR